MGQRFVNDVKYVLPTLFLCLLTGFLERVVVRAMFVYLLKSDEKGYV